jgi:hypothetical protein
MRNTNTVEPANNLFKPCVDGLDQFDQSAELARLWECAGKLCAGHPSYLIRRGVVRCLKLDLLRYGNLPASHPSKAGFGVIRDSGDFRKFVYSRILPEEFICGFLLSCVSFGYMVLGVRYNPDDPDFTFALTGSIEAIGEVWDECERHSDQNTNPELVN